MAYVHFASFIVPDVAAYCQLQRRARAGLDITSMLVVLPQLDGPGGHPAHEMPTRIPERKRIVSLQLSEDLRMA